MKGSTDAARTLCIDIGGTGLKMLVADAKGDPLCERARVATPRPATPNAVVAAITRLIRRQPPFDRVSVGFPGVVVDDVILTAPNLHPTWHGHKLGKTLARLTHRPVRVANDADVQGFGVIKGKGVEMVITLGTGMGSAIFVNGKLVPNLELGHHPWRKDKTYEDLLGAAALQKAGRKKWRKRVREAVDTIAPVWNYQVLYLGGGSAKHLQPEEFPANVKIVSNTAGLFGGVDLWA
jgi:polyphosphate glucokinase